MPPTQNADKSIAFLLSTNFLQSKIQILRFEFALQRERWQRKLTEEVLICFKVNSYKAKKKAGTFVPAFFFGADYGARTRHLDLGKVALYQMS